MHKPIAVRLLKEAEEYFESLDERVQDKFLKSFDKTRIGLYGEWFQKLYGTDGIWEFRARDHHKFYRILAFWDKEGDSETLILVTHGFDKKSNRTPMNEIQHAEQLKMKYFNNKENK
jgi:phage-related protein